MAIRASDRVTLAVVAAPSYVRQYYLLQASTLNPPAAPTTNPPVAPWTTVEPNYTEGSTSTLYTVMLTAYGSVAFEYGPVQKSSSYEAAKTAVNKAVAAITVANLAEQAAADLIRASQTDPGHAPGRIWIILDAQGNTVGIKQSVDGVWTSYALMADQLIVPGSVGTASIRDGAMTAPKITASEELWAKIAVFAKITTEQLVAGGATITGTMLADIIQLASRLVAGNPSGDRTELDATGLHVWRNGVEQARLSASGNGLQVWNDSMGRLVNLASVAFGGHRFFDDSLRNLDKPTQESAVLEFKPGTWRIYYLNSWTAPSDRVSAVTSFRAGNDRMSRDGMMQGRFGLRIGESVLDTIWLTDSGGTYYEASQATRGSAVELGTAVTVPGQTYNLIFVGRAGKFTGTPDFTPSVKSLYAVITPL